MSPITADVLVGTPKLKTRREEDQLIAQAIALVEARMFKVGSAILRTTDVRNYLRLNLVPEPSEVFAALFLNNRHRVLAFERLFQGTVDGTTVHSRVVVQRALFHNAAAVIFAHQHPSGDTTPSEADRDITKRLQSALELVDVRVLDHFVIGNGTPFSFAKAGLL